MRGLVLVGCVCVGTLASTLWAQATAVRSGVTSDAHIYLTPDQGEDQSLVVDDQMATVESLNAVGIAQIDNSSGSFSGMVTGSVVFDDASGGSFAAGMEFGGAGAPEPMAQTFGQTNNCEFQYDFMIDGEGSLDISGLLFNDSTVFESIASFKVYRELVAGEGYGNFFFSQFIVDTENTGTVPFSFSAPLVAESGSYRVEMRIYSNSLGSLDRPTIHSVLNASFSIDSGAACVADLNGDGVLDFFDVSAFLSAFGSMDLTADFNGDGVLDFFDVSAFLTAFGAGCP